MKTNRFTDRLKEEVSRVANHPIKLKDAVFAGTVIAPLVVVGVAVVILDHTNVKIDISSQ